MITPTPSVTTIGDQRARIWLDNVDLSRPWRRSRLVPVLAESSPVLRWSAPVAEVDVIVQPLASDTPIWVSRKVREREIVVEVDLRPHARYRVMLIDSQSGAVLCDDEVETAFFASTQWESLWIELGTGDSLRADLPAAELGDVVRIHVAAQGLAYIEIGGIPVNAGALDSTRTHHSRALYRTYDITDLVERGGTQMTIECGQGAWARSGKLPRVIAQATYLHLDGRSSQYAVLGGVAPGIVREDVPFYLEVQDQRNRHLDIQSITAPRVLESNGSAPQVLIADTTPPTHVADERSASPVGRTRSGARVFDAGVNTAGRARVFIDPPLPSGVRVRVEHGEVLGSDGGIDTTNITMPYDNGRSRQNFAVVGDGVSDGFAPWFAYYGFRYVAVLGLPEGHAVEVTVQTLHTDLRRRAELVTNNETLNELMVRASRTQLNNLHGVPEDCPTREQAAWTGDVASSVDYLFTEYDATPLMSNWLKDLLLSADPDGVIPAVAPDARTPPFPGEPVWGAALHRVLQGIRLHGGDSQALRSSLPGLRSWARAQLTWRDERGVIANAPISYGHDWLALEQTPPELLHSVATIECLNALATLEQELGDESAAVSWKTARDELRTAVRAVFWDEGTGFVGSGSQAGYACAVQSGVLQDEDAVRAVSALAANIEERGLLITGGFAGVRHIVGALSTHGYHQLLFDLMNIAHEPGIGAMLASGPGTFWECWWRDHTNTGTGSLDHIGLGAPFAAWMWAGVLGLEKSASRPASFQLSPANIAGLDTINATVDTAFGHLVVRVRRVDATRMDVDLSAPEGVEVICKDVNGLQHFRGGHRTLRMRMPQPRASHRVARADWGGYPRANYSRHDPLDMSDLVAEIPASLGHVDIVSAPRCMPIPHAQIDGAGWRVRAASNSSDAPSIHFLLRDTSSELPAGRYYALVDTCGADVTLRARVLIRVHLTTGRTVEATCRVWPAGLNRVCVDVRLAPSESIARIEVQARLTTRAVDSDEPAEYTVVSIGRDIGPRTW